MDAGPPPHATVFFLLPASGASFFLASRWAARYLPPLLNLIAIARRDALDPMHRSTKVQCLGAAGFFIALYALNVCRRRVCRAEQRGRP